MQHESSEGGQKTNAREREGSVPTTSDDGDEETRERERKRSPLGVGDWRKSRPCQPAAVAQLLLKLG